MHTLIEYWNGQSWRVQASPNPVVGNNILTGVSAASSADVWAVGYTESLSGSQQALIEHWNGRSWSVQANPHLSNWTKLNAVAATSASNAWAVGTNSNPTVPSSVALIEHWNGHSWQVQSRPHPGDFLNELLAVDAMPGGGTWAVGDYNTKSIGEADHFPLIEHWNGRAWQEQPSPQQPAGNEYVPSAVSILSSHSVWMAGSRADFNAQRTLIENWNGLEWKVQSAPNPALGDLDADLLYGVAATSASNVWAVGSYQVKEDGGSKTLIEHWNGRTWTRQSSPNPG
ncbi:MAG: hypothetical protein J2P28_00690 [Actinobacteria bacterium]|nr:hypothetical protein [Actinomycetota bacterium]